MWIWACRRGSLLARLCDTRREFRTEKKYGDGEVEGTRKCTVDSTADLG